MKKILYDLLYMTICICFILLVYQLIAIIENNMYVLPDLTQVFKKTIQLFSESKFWNSLFATLLRTIVGFLISFIIAITTAIIYKLFNLTKKFILIIMGIIRAVPTVAIILNLVMWTNSRVAPVIIACLVTLPQLFSTISEQLENFDHNIIDMCKLYEVSDKEIFTNVYLPYVMPRLALSLCSNFSLTLKLIGSSEALCSTLNSIGFMMKDAKDSIDPARLIAISIICIVMAIILENTLKLLIKKIWRIR